MRKLLLSQVRLTELVDRRLMKHSRTSTDKTLDRIDHCKHSATMTEARSNVKEGIVEGKQRTRLLTGKRGLLRFDRSKLRKSTTEIEKK